MVARENNDAFADLAAALDEVVAALKEMEAAFTEVYEEITKQLSEINYTERKKCKPPLFVHIPPKRYPSFKLWRTNKALFRPYRREWRGNKNTENKRRVKLYELF